MSSSRRSSGDSRRNFGAAAPLDRLTDPGPWPEVGLGLRVWQGAFEGLEDVWLRWCDANGEIIPTAEERVRQLEAELRRVKGKRRGKSS